MNVTELDSVLAEADRRMKSADGHQFVTMLKTRCQYCGRSPSQTKGKRCGGWFASFIDHTKIVMFERGFLTAADAAIASQRGESTGNPEKETTL